MNTNLRLLAFLVIVIHIPELVGTVSVAGGVVGGLSELEDEDVAYRRPLRLQVN